MDVKEIKVTEEFLGLGEKETGCGVKEVKSDCVTRRYRDHLLASCGCAPFSLASHYGKEVQVTFSEKKIIPIITRRRYVTPPSWTVWPSWRWSPGSVWSGARAALWRWRGSGDTKMRKV